MGETFLIVTPIVRLSSSSEELPDTPTILPRLLSFCDCRTGSSKAHSAWVFQNPFSIALEMLVRLRELMPSRSCFRVRYSTPREDLSDFTMHPRRWMARYTLSLPMASWQAVTISLSSLKRLGREPPYSSVRKLELSFKNWSIRYPFPAWTLHGCEK